VEESFNSAAPVPTVAIGVPCNDGGDHGPTQAATSALPPQLAAVNLHAAGIDVGAETHVVAVAPSDDAQPVRRFGAYTIDLEALAD
jgi:hypothetical protein